MREWIVALALVVLILREAQAHDGYKDWTNWGGQGCCNDHDCDRIEDIDIKTVRTHVEVRIKGEWCEVKPHHYLKTGNAPDWSSAHVCIQKSHYLLNRPPTHGKGGTVCHTLLCFQPKPQF